MSKNADPSASGSVILHKTMCSLLTNDGRAANGGNALEEEKETEGVGELVKSEQVHQHHAGQPHVGAARHPEYCAVYSLRKKKNRQRN